MFIVIDFEATCSNQKEFPRHEMEIIEIGAVLCDSDFSIRSTFQSFVRPIRHPTLTAFCTELTTITQEEVSNAPLFSEMLSSFLQWRITHKAESAIFCSWGNFDRNILRENCQFHDCEYPFQHHINLKTRFSEKQKRKPCGMGKALHIVGLPLMGTHHRGIDDAQNIATLLPFCLEK